MHTTPLVKLVNVSKQFVKGGENIRLFDHLTLEVEAGEFLSVMGPSGSGKSTLLNLLAGIDRPTSGEVYIENTRIDKLTESKLADFRAARLGFVFQFYNLIPILTAAQNVELPLMLRHMSRSDRRTAVKTALDVVNLSGRAGHFPREMSGGEQQRVAIARAIVGSPQLILCDEPTGDLDRNSALEIAQVLKQLNEQFNRTIVLVTHDPAIAAYARRQLHLDKALLMQRRVAA